MQTYNNYEVFISDDSKTNDVENVLLDYNDLPIHYVHNKISLGTSDNVNQAIKCALDKGAAYIKILFQDDWFSEKDSLKKMLDYLECHNLDVLFVANYEVYTNKTTIHTCDRTTVNRIINDSGVLFRGNYLGAPSILLYKACDTMFDRGFTWLLDVDFYLRLLRGRRIDYWESPLISIGHDGEQLTDYYIDRPLKMLDETKRQLTKYSWLNTPDNIAYYRSFRIRMIIRNIKCFVKKVIKLI
jgi:GT2 family glycosyltransferase